MWTPALGRFLEKALNEAFVPTMSKVKNGRQMDSDWIKKNLQGSITDEQLYEENIYFYDYFEYHLYSNLCR